MTARSFLVRGLLAGLLAGIACFLVAHQVGEPHVEAAIALEESAAAGRAESADHAHAHDDAGHDDDDAGHAHADPSHSHGEDAVVGRGTQRTWGLLTASLAVGVALGGLAGLVAAAVVGRLGRLSPVQSTAVVGAVGFVAVALVPFLKYPATPPAVGSPDTIGERTGWFFVLVGISVAAAAAAVVLAVRLWPRLGAYAACVGAAAAYTSAMVAVGLALPTVNEVGAFPADTLWFFRRASLFTQAALWGTLGVALTGFVVRLHRDQSARQARRELAASL